MSFLSTLNMAGGLLSGLSVTCSIVGLLGFYLCQDVECSTKNQVIHKKVGDPVDLLTSLPSNNVTIAEWTYKGGKVADKDKVDTEMEQFKGRVHLNPHNFTLTIKKLSLKDSGDYLFLSEVNNEQQRATVTINLQVHEPIVNKPFLKVVNVVRNGSTESCTVTLECSTTSDPSVIYNWTVGKLTQNGPRLQHILTPQDGETDFTCTVSNYVSQKSASIKQQCRHDILPVTFKLVLGVALGCCLVIVIVAVVVVRVCCFKRKPPDSDAGDLTVYADISDVVGDDTMKGSPQYETIRGPINPAPQTIYDEIQFSRMMAESMSPYQEVS